MDNRIKEAFGQIQASEQLVRSTRASLRRKTFDYGRNVIRIRTHNRRLAAGLLSLVLIFSGMGLWFLPSARISVEVNPSIELRVNALDRVIALEGKNSDGIALVKDIDVVGMPYDDAMQRILLSSGMAPYLESQAMITITVAGGGTEAHADRMLERVLCRAFNIARKENILYCQVDWETVKAAEAVNLCIPRYLAWQNLRKSDPTVTAEDVRQIPKETVWELAQTEIVEDPCH